MSFGSSSPTHLHFRCFTQIHFYVIRWAHALNYCDTCLQQYLHVTPSIGMEPSINLRPQVSSPTPQTKHLPRLFSSSPFKRSYLVGISTEKNNGAKSMRVKDYFYGYNSVHNISSSPVAAHQILRIKLLKCFRSNGICIANEHGWFDDNKFLTFSFSVFAKQKRTMEWCKLWNYQVKYESCEKNLKI